MKRIFIVMTIIVIVLYAHVHAECVYNENVLNMPETAYDNYNFDSAYKADEYYAPDDYYNDLNGAMVDLFYNIDITENI